MFETGTSATVRSFHVMPGMPPPEGERHSHDYRFDVVVTRDELDERGMVVDLDVLDEALTDLTTRLDDADLDAIVAPDMGVEAVTVEVFAQWVHAQLAKALVASLGDKSAAAGSGVVVLGVRVFENATAFGGYRAPLA
jgi:6-pyruvoyltetrahydropterin/6-carboxytetrahydropterin synthase